MNRIILLILMLYSSNLGAQMDSLNWQSMDRTYLVHLPVNFDNNVEYPLVIAMHGGFGSAINIENQSQLNVKADDENFIVVYPEGVKGGFFNIRTWNAGWCCGYASSSDIDDVGFIDVLLDTLISKYPIDEDRIYATGMSNGGFMSYRLACELSDRIAAIAPVAASMSLTSCTPARSVPVLDFHSYLDSNVPIQGGFGTGASNHYSSPLDSVLNVWSTLNNCQIKNDTIINNNEFTHIRWTNCNCNYQIEQYITQDGGHSWPGGKSTPLGDPISEFINANDIMWDFFQKYSLECSTTSIENKTPIAIEPEIYPNPTDGFLMVNFENVPSNVKMTIFNTLGHIVHFSKNTQEIDLQHLQNAFYFILIEYDKNKFYYKFLKTK